VELRQFVIRRPLVHLGEITGCAADADDGQVDVLDPGDGGHFFADEFHQAGNGVGVRVALGAEFFSQRDGADGDRQRMNGFAIADQGHFDAGTAQVKDEEIFHGNGVDDAEITQVRFAFAADDFHRDARFRIDALQEGFAVAGIADGCCRDSPAFMDVHDFHDVFIDVQAGQGPLHPFFADDPGLAQAVAQADGFLFLVEQGIGLVVGNLHDDKADGVRAHVDDG